MKLPSVDPAAAPAGGPPPLTLALSKGRIFDDTLPLLQRAGITVADDPESSRRLILPTSRPDLRVVLVRASDVPTYVQYGGADLGVAGLDTLLEHEGALFRPLDLAIARCRMSVAVRTDFDYASAVRQGSRLRVATKYTRIAHQHFAAKGVHVDLIKLYGSMELAPLTGLADAIVDLVSTGSTLRANQLVEVERICEISARLVVNPAALKLQGDRLRPLIDDLAAAVAAQAVGSAEPQPARAAEAA
jgi:ATP phosphoribosyltransferase